MQNRHELAFPGPDPTLAIRRPPPWIFLVVALWLALIGTGMTVLWRHRVTPGQPAQAPMHWPAKSTLQPAEDRATVVIWCHPRCPDNQASLEKLAELVHHTRGRVAVFVVFRCPPGYPQRWVRGRAWRHAATIPGARLIIDDGREALRFGVRTSGQTLIFGKDRHLRFNGGLIAGRGYRGESEHLKRATFAAGIDTVSVETAPVFGSALFTPEEEALAAKGTGPLAGAASGAQL